MLGSSLAVVYQKDNPNVNKQRIFHDIIRLVRSLSDFFTVDTHPPTQGPIEQNPPMLVRWRVWIDSVLQNIQISSQKFSKGIVLKTYPTQVARIDRMKIRFLIEALLQRPILIFLASDPASGS